MKHFSHLNTAVELIEQYKRELPFSIFLRSYFTQHKKYGSRDRKTISNCCYCYFRLGYAVESLPIEDKILLGLFLCERQSNELLQHFKPAWNAKIELSIDEKISMLNNENIPFSIKDIFPWKELLSEGIDHEQFCRSFLIQPDLFLRLRPGYETIVKQKLAGIEFTECSPTCLSLPNTTKVDSIISLDKEAVVQDLNSQRTGDFLTSGVKVWDCCAASGGKSILAYDLIPNIQLTVSDIRESIIHNLKKRLANADIKNYNAFVADLTKQYTQKNNFDLIICDAPCSGSGTWGRTPEQLVFFDPASSLNHYSSLQQKITSNIIPHLKSGGRLVYITCSVFKKENEDAVNYILNKFSLELERMEILKGYDRRADTLFAAALIKK